MADTATATNDTDRDLAVKTAQDEHGMKRGHSEDHEEESQSKRQRTSPGKKSPEVARDSAVADGLQDAPATTITEDKAQAAGATQRKPSVVDEKQRSKRLFGALLRNLRQPGDRTSKRRQEIETRRKAELQRQDDERLEDRQRRKKKLVEHRVVIQDEVDERTMRERHRQMLDRANFLQTETEPKLYYRPWDLRDAEEDRIDDQIKSAQKQIDDEIVDFNERHGRKTSPAPPSDLKETEQNGVEARSEGETAAGSAPHDDKEFGSQDQASAKSTNHQVNMPADDAPGDLPNTDADTNDEHGNQTEHRPGSRQMADEGEEEVERIGDGDEDTVIY